MLGPVDAKIRIFSAMAIAALAASLTLPVEAAPPAKAPAGTAAAKKSDAAWHKLADTAERYINQCDLANGFKFYVAALQGAVAAKASCSDLKFRQLLALGGSVCALGARPIGGESPSSDTARTNTATETALKWKLHAATAICGSASAAYAEALENLVAFYVTSGNRAMQIQYSDKSAQAAQMLTGRDAADLEILRNATHARIEVVTGARVQR